MSRLFRKAAVFTDIHWGLKNNSLQHNVDCDRFVDWFIETAKANGCETGMFLGDWHNHRASINLQTLKFSVRALEKLSAAFTDFFFIPGNHDLYYRDKRDIHGVEWAKYIPNIHIMNDWNKDSDVIYAPWLVGDDYKKIKTLNAEYMFGHFELPHFKMNAMVEMPDHGELQTEHMQNFGTVFSGHFHLRQTKNNITYIGNAFPHNFSDAGDDKRGMMILEWGGEPEYVAWPEQPLYKVCQLSELINDQVLLTPNMHVRVQIDIDISYEEANFIRETFIGKHELREMALMPKKNIDMHEEISNDSIKFESVDQIVTQHLTDIESEVFDPKLLLKIYQTL